MRICLGLYDPLTCAVLAYVQYICTSGLGPACFRTILSTSAVWLSLYIQIKVCWVKRDIDVLGNDAAGTVIDVAERCKLGLIERVLAVLEMNVLDAPVGCATDIVAVIMSCSPVCNCFTYRCKASRRRWGFGSLFRRSRPAGLYPWSRYSQSSRHSSTEIEIVEKRRWVGLPHGNSLELTKQRMEPCT